MQFSGGDAAGPGQAKEERVDDQPPAGGAAGKRLRQPVLFEEAQDGQGAQTVKRILIFFFLRPVKQLFLNHESGFFSKPRLIVFSVAFFFLLLFPFFCLN